MQRSPKAITYNGGSNRQSGGGFRLPSRPTSSPIFPALLHRQKMRQLGLQEHSISGLTKTQVFLNFLQKGFALTSFAFCTVTFGTFLYYVLSGRGKEDRIKGMLEANMLVPIDQLPPKESSSSVETSSPSVETSSPSVETSSSSAETSPSL